MKRFIFLITLVAVSLPAFAQDAQTTREQERAAAAAAEAAREAAEKRVEADMLKMNNLVEALSKNLGQLHYLRTLCFGDDDQLWREKTAEMMDVEVGDDVARRRDIIRAFNAGYNQERDRFSTCSNAVSLDAAALSENARNIATMLGDPFREQ
ncbi:TIGR02301 family protein [Fretibacter rubidus]|uniref:TIGR02301 family protein n=1 Tax=Fretibacter rubidus TaxID=570162 RepID=UPI00352A4ECE